MVGVKELVRPPSGTASLPGGVVIITNDEAGKAELCADRFADFGQDVVIVSHRSESGDYKASSFCADLTEESQVAALLADVRENLGPVGGLVHLLPFCEQGAQETNAQRANRDVKSLYLITRAVETEICEIGKNENAFVLSSTVLGGQLGFGSKQLEVLGQAGTGAISGYLKCLGMEWPDVLVRSIDFDHGCAADKVVDVFEREMGDLAGPYEVGYTLEGKRYTWDPESSSLSTSKQAVELDSDSVILITGGARGITAAIAEEFASRFQSHLILVGRSPLPEEQESAITKCITDKAEIKKAIIESIVANGEKPIPAEIEERFRKLMVNRELFENIANIEKAGSTVEYRSVDVRDRAGMTKLIESLYSKFGKIDGVVHGAGVIDDKLVKDKTPESFDKVFSTKVESAYLLAELLQPESLKFVSFFASIASRYGNRGQSDYAAANEVLCKLATELERRWAARVFAVAWGPWTGIGMVADLEKHLTARGIALIDSEVGCRMFVDEVIYGAAGDSEVIIAGGAENMITPSTNQVEAEATAKVGV